MILYQVDAFAERAFTGNPAAVCLADAEPDAGWMQLLAAEMNLSETVYVWPDGDEFGLRWFTPAVEVRLCGHATLAAAHALWESGRLDAGAEARFRTASGTLSARRAGRRIELDMPAIATEPAPPPDGALEALGVTPVAVERTSDLERHEPLWVLELESAAAVRAAAPSFARLGALGALEFVVTSRADGGGHDYVARMFAPGVGIDEDPVTGAAHCRLGPYWSVRLGRETLVGRQVSARGGTVHVRLERGRAVLGGTAVTVFEARLAAEASPPSPVTR